MTKINWEKTNYDNNHCYYVKLNYHISPIYASLVKKLNNLAMIMHNSCANISTRVHCLYNCTSVLDQIQYSLHQSALYVSRHQCAHYLQIHYHRHHCALYLSRHQCAHFSTESISSAPLCINCTRHQCAHYSIESISSAPLCIIYNTAPVCTLFNRINLIGTYVRYLWHGTSVPNIQTVPFSQHQCALTESRHLCAHMTNWLTKQRSVEPNA